MRRIEIVVPSQYVEGTKIVLKVYTTGQPLRDEPMGEKTGFHRLWYTTEHELEFITFLVKFFLHNRDPKLEFSVTELPILH